MALFRGYVKPVSVAGKKTVFVFVSVFADVCQRLRGSLQEVLKVIIVPLLSEVQM